VAFPRKAAHLATLETALPAIFFWALSRNKAIDTRGDVSFFKRFDVFSVFHIFCIAWYGHLGE
jgi:hypothetical protein